MSLFQFFSLGGAAIFVACLAALLVINRHLNDAPTAAPQPGRHRLATAIEPYRPAATHVVANPDRPPVFFVAGPDTWDDETRVLVAQDPYAEETTVIASLVS